MLILRDFQSKIVDLVNNSGLPIDYIYFVMKDIMRDIESTYNDYVRKELNEIAKEQMEKQKEEENSSEDKKDQS